MYHGALYILSPGDTSDLDLIQVVVLSDDMLRQVFSPDKLRLKV